MAGCDASFVCGLAAAALAVPATADAILPDPPKIPSSTSKAQKRCGTVERSYVSGSTYRYEVWVIRGGLSCAKARRIAKPGRNTGSFFPFDWTKGGNGRWSDVWTTRNHRKVVGAIIQGV